MSSQESIVLQAKVPSDIGFWWAVLGAIIVVSLSVRAVSVFASYLGLDAPVTTSEQTISCGAAGRPETEINVVRCPSERGS